jgi:putative ABC transport system ATP-binding protein
MAETCNNEVVSLEDVHKSYRRGSVDSPVLRGVNLRVGAGRCVFLAGPSGSGKTTLLSILGGILRPDRGHVWLMGEDITTLTEQERIVMRRHRIGFVFQRFHLIRGLSALENVAVPLTLQHVPLRDANRRARELLGEVGLGDHLHAPPGKLSTGQCQRVALARALVADPDLILADEPTAALDETNGQTVMQLLRHLTSDQGKTAIVVTHDARIFRFADQVCRMESGHVVEEIHGPGESTRSTPPAHFIENEQRS